MGETYYDVLGVEPTATEDEIRTAYRDRVLETHPDHNDDPDAADQFRRVSTAKSVLTDGAERARYDRLGHESYVRLAQHSSAGDPSEATDDDRSSATDAETAREDTASTAKSRRQRTDRTGRTTGRERNRHTAQQRGERSSTSRTRGQGRSHHARQRSRRHRQTSAKRSHGGAVFDTDGDRSSTGGREATRQTNTAGTETASKTGFSYDVHNWDDEIELNPDRHRLDQPTIIGLGAVTALYPLLVYASLTPLFSVVTNAIVTACTLILVGYMLAIPRIAVLSFGGWSILLPLGLYVSPIDPFSIYGLLAIAFCWIPFGFALAVRWALQP